MDADMGPRTLSRWRLRPRTDDAPTSRSGHVAVVDPEGLFEEPVRFGQGALDARLRLQPFQIDIGQLALVEGDERLLLAGRAMAEATGWDAALDLDLNQIATELDNEPADFDAVRSQHREQLSVVRAARAVQAG